MPRNLDRRIELLAPIEDAQCKQRLISILDTYFDDTVKARQLKADGSYVRPKKSKTKRRRSQEVLYEEARQRVREAEQTQRTTFEPHRSATAAG